MATGSSFAPNRRALLLAGAGSVLLPAAGTARADWPAAGPAVAPAALAQALDAGAQAGGLRALAVAHEGRLVAERFYGGADPGALYRINSATKSVSSVLVGIALAQGKLRSLSQTLAELLPEAAAAHPGSPAAQVTLAQVLTGTTGLAYDWTRQSHELAAAPDPVGFAFGLARAGAPGAAWSYNDAAVGLLTPILERAWGVPLEEAARLHLAAPLGIARFGWDRDKTGRVLAYGGLRLQLRDLLKLAWTMADGGRWQGHRVVPSEWVAESTRRHVGGAWPNPPLADSGYGHLWFTGRHKDVPVAWAWGYGAQFALLAPTLRLAVATAASEPPPAQLPAQNRAVAAVVAGVLDAFT